MKRYNYIPYTAALVGLLLAVSSCQSDEEWTDDSVVKVPVSFLLQSSGTRAEDSENNGGTGEEPLIKNPRNLYADRVQLNVYRRAAEGNYTNETDGFVIDQTLTLKCMPIAEGNSFRRATGVANLKKGYEYRTTALAYSDEKKEKPLFSFTHATENAFVNAKITLTNQEQYKTPELFFGTPRYGATPENKNAGTVVFTTYRDSGIGIYGILYRCVAGVELTLTEVPSTVSKLTLLAGKLHTESTAMNYDDFLNPSGEKVSNPTQNNKFILTQWERPTNETGVMEVKLTDANLLPVDASPLYMLITQTDGTESIVHIHVKHKNTGSEQTDSYPEGGSGTGIIPNPEETPDDPIINRGDLNFKRNHYYRITGSYKQLTTSELPLMVTINPYWDGDHELDMNK